MTGGHSKKPANELPRYWWSTAVDAHFD